MDGNNDTLTTEFDLPAQLRHTLPLQSVWFDQEQGSLNGRKAEKSETEREDKEQIGPGSLRLVLESSHFFNEFQSI